MDNKVRTSTELGGDSPISASADLDSTTDKLLEIAVNMGYFDDMAEEALEEYRRGEVTDL